MGNSPLEGTDDVHETVHGHATDIYAGQRQHSHGAIKNRNPTRGAALTVPMPRRRLQRQRRGYIAHKIHHTHIRKHLIAIIREFRKRIIQIDVRVAPIRATGLHERRPARPGIKPKRQLLICAEPDAATPDVREGEHGGLACGRELDGAVLGEGLVCRALWWGGRIVLCFAIGGEEEELVHVVDVVAGDVAEDCVVGGVVFYLDGEGGHLSIGVGGGVLDVSESSPLAWLACQW